MEAPHTKIRLEGSLLKQTRVLELTARVDPDMPHLCLPRAVVHALGLEARGTRNVPTAYGAEECAYVGPVTVQCGGRAGFMGAVQWGDEIVLGHVCLGALGLIYDEDSQQLIAVPLRA